MSASNIYPWISLTRHSDQNQGAGPWRSAGQPHVRYGEILSSQSQFPERGTEGVHASWSFDGDTLTLRNDYFGCAPLFYYHDKDQFFACPSLLPFTENLSDLSLDYDSLSIFMRLGYFLGTDTVFKNVKALPVHSTLTWKNGTITLTSGIEPPAPDDTLTREAALDGYIDLFRQAMEKRKPSAGETVIPLSGGRDSRHIFLEALRQNFPNLHTRTTSMWPSAAHPREDRSVAKHLATINNVPIEEIPPASDILQNERLKNLLSSFCSDEHSMFLPVMMSTHSASTVIDGIGGDIFSDGDFYHPDFVAPYMRGDFHAVADPLVVYDDQGASILGRALGTSLRSRDFVTERMINDLQSYAHFPNPVVQWFFENRTRREISLAPFGLWGASKSVRAPFLDIDLNRFLMSLPAHYLENGTFHTDAIANAYPEMAHIPYSGFKPSASKLYLANIARKVIAKAFATPTSHKTTPNSKLATDTARYFWRYARDGGKHQNWRSAYLAIQLLGFLRGENATMLKELETIMPDYRFEWHKLDIAER